MTKQQFTQMLQDRALSSEIPKQQLQSFLRQKAKRNFEDYEVDNFMAYFNYNHSDKVSVKEVADQLYEQ